MKFNENSSRIMYLDRNSCPHFDMAKIIASFTIESQLITDTSYSKTERDCCKRKKLAPTPK